MHIFKLPFYVKCFFVVLLLINNLSGTAQYNTRYSSVQHDLYTKFYNYYKADGICSYLFTDIFQDSKGYMWFATREGLMRFDGYTFETYKMGEFPNTLPHSDVRKIVEDGSGRLWVGTMGGLCYYNPKTNDFSRVTQVFGKQLQGGKGVFALFIDSKGRLWADMQEGALHCIDFKNEKLEIFQHRSQENDIFYFQSLTEVNNNILVGGAHSLLTKLSLSTNRWFNFNDTIVNDNHLKIRAAAQFFHKDEKELWVANFSYWSYTINKKTLERGCLPFISAYTFERHPDGRIWVGGYSGGARLYDSDKNAITIYRTNENNPYSIAGETIYKIFNDNQGNTWFATNGGLSVLSQHRNRYKHIRKIPESGGLTTNKITSVLPEEPNLLWLGTENKGLINFNLKTGTSKTYKFFNNPDSIGSNTVTHVTRYDDKTLLLTLWNGNGGALNSFNIPKQKFTRYHTPDNYYWYRSVQKHSSGQVFVGSWGAGVYSFNFDKESFFGRYYNAMSNSFFSSQTNKMHTISANKNGWVVGQRDLVNAINVITGDSCFVLNGQKKLYNQINIGDPRGIYYYFNAVYIDKIALMNQKVVGILFDKSSSLVEVDLEKKTLQRFDFNLGKGFTSVWADTCVYLGASGRVYRWDSVLKKLIKIIESEQLGEPTCSMGLSNGLLAVGANNGLFVAVFQGANSWQIVSKLTNSNVNQTQSIDEKKFFATSDGLIQLSAQGEIQKRFFEGTNVVALTADSAGHLWVSTDRSLFRMNLQLGTIEEVLPNTKSPNGLLSNIVYSMTTDAKGNVWMLTKRCISMYNPQTMKYTNYIEPNETGIFSNLVSEMFEDAKGNIWIGATRKGGVSRIDPINQKVSSFVHLEWDSLSFPHASTWCISETSNGQMLFGTSEGLAIMEGNKNRFRLIDDKHGLPSKEVTAVLQDDNGLVWVGTSNGMAKLHLNSGIAEPISVSEGALTGTITDMQLLGSDKIVVAGEWGLNIFNPNLVGKDSAASPLHIGSIWVDGAIARRAPSNKEIITIEASHKNLEIFFTALDFRAPENVKYRYQLVGFDPAFTEVSFESRVARYSSLPHGTYTFTLYSTNADGIWGKHPATVVIQVNAPFYLTWWFILLILVSLTGLIITIFRARTAWLQKEKAILERLVNFKNKELLEQNEELKASYEIIALQTDKIKHINKHLTDSIEYALTLQEELMPKPTDLKQLLAAHFLLYWPKDIVSGDFYWARETQDVLTIVVADCTGHGVHGGFMSMMGLTFVNEVYKANPKSNPAQMVDQIHSHFVASIKLVKQNSWVTTGMDLAICKIDRKTRQLQFAGTHLPIYVLKRGGTAPQLNKLTSGSKPVGSPWFTPGSPLVEVAMAEGDWIILTTDGAFDQLSQVERKRFNRKQFEELLQQHSSGSIEQLGRTLHRELNQWRGSAIQSDDVTVLGFEV